MLTRSRKEANITKKFNIIYADPPWPCRGAEKHYKTMKPSEICALPVSELAAEDSVLFLWATFPTLPHAFDVIKAWGFTYITVAFVWVKRNRISPNYFFGMGQWTRANAEICLLAVKGKPKRKAANVRQIIDSPIEQHSKKPNETRNRIIEPMGDLPRIELFARQAPIGWDIWSNEIESTINFGPC